MDEDRSECPDCENTGVIGYGAFGDPISCDCENGIEQEHPRLGILFLIVLAAVGLTADVFLWSHCGSDKDANGATRASTSTQQ